VLALGLTMLAMVAGAPAQAVEPPPPVAWRVSTPVGLPFRGKLRHGVQLPEWGIDFFTWDPVLKQVPDRPWRRWGTHTTVATIIGVLHEFRLAHPEAPRIGVGDLSRPHGGPFGRRYGGLGHSSHQNGLDVDVYYPRRDAREEQVWNPRQVDHALAQDLVDRFVDAGAQYVFVGPRVGLHGKRGVVQVLAHHDDHLHVRFPPP